MAAQMTPRFRDLPDVNWASFTDGEVPTYDEGTDTITGETGGGDSSAALAAHNDDTSFVHGIVNTADLATDAELAAHAANTTAVHGIADTSVLATDGEVATAVTDHNGDTTGVHGISNTSQLVYEGDLEDFVERTELSSKGDLFVGTDDGGVEAAPLHVSGSNGWVLTSNDQLDAGVEWAEPDAGGVSQEAVDTTVANHSADTTAVHGISDTSALATSSSVASAVSAHEADTTSVHGIANTAVLATATSVATAVSNHEADTTAVHGIADTSALATSSSVTSAVSAHEADTSVHGIADTTVLATDAEVVTAVSDHSADTTAVHGIANTASLLTSPIAESDVTGLTSALAGKQPVDSDLTSLAALTTTSFGRGLLELANQGALLTATGAAAASHSHAESDVTNLTSDLAAKVPNSLVDAKGDILTATANDTPARLAVGTNDFVLTADSAATNGIKWAAAASGGIAATIVDAKGDLIVGTAADTVARKAAGSNGTVLVSDSSDGSGLVWQLAAPAPMRVAGRYYPCCPLAVDPGSGALTQSRQFFWVIFIEYTSSFDRAALDVTGVASATERVGVYNDSSGSPGTLIADWGTLDCSTTGTKELTMSWAPTRGAYWLSCAAQGAATNSRRQTPCVQVGSSGSGVGPRPAACKDSVTGAFADASSLSFNTSAANVPAIMLRAA